MTSIDEVREQINAAKETTETVMTRIVDSNPMRRSEYMQPGYASNDQPEQYRQSQPQFQSRQPQRSQYQQPQAGRGRYQGY
jgi:hypothetical protein